MSEEHVFKETVIYLNSIQKWLHENLKLPLTTNNSFTKSNLKPVKNLQITNVCDIEESIWSPIYGFKGKLDLTLQVEIKMSAFKTLNQVSNSMNKKDQVESHIIPVELKSGRTKFSAEHEGQVMLYSLLNKEKRKKSDFGLLLYLKDMNMKFIKVNEVSLRGCFFFNKNKDIIN
jgi:DNA replication ATP-dependent helicase Dna2